MKINLYSVAILAGVLASGTVQPLFAEQSVSNASNIYTIKSTRQSATTSIGGTVNATKEVSLTAQIPGRVTFIAGKEGHAVNQGQLLIKLDDAALQANLNSAQAQQASARASIRNANAQLNREIKSPGISSNAPGGMALPSMMDRMFTNPMQDMMGMRQQGAERQADLIARQSAVDQAVAALSQSQSQITTINAKLRDSKSIAPFSGVIVKNFVESGDTVQPGQPLMTFADTSSLQVDVDIPMRSRSVLALGQSVQVSVDAIAGDLTATVSRIHPIADKIRHTIHIELALPQHPSLSAGMYAKIKIPSGGATSTGTTIKIPASAVVSRGGLSLVFLVNQNNQAAIRMVRIGSSGQANVEILSGLNNGDRIVLAPDNELQSGDTVN